MAHPVASVPRAIPTTLRIPLREVLPWLVFAGAILLTLLYLVGMDQGATSLFSGSMLHEFLHDDVLCGSGDRHMQVADALADIRRYDVAHEKLADARPRYGAAFIVRVRPRADDR